MRISRLLPFAATLALAACMDHPPPAAAPPEVAPTAVPLAQVPAATIERYLGTYRSGADSIVIRRSGASLFADRSGLPSAAPLTIVGLGTFADAAGTAYLFMPADGSGGRLRTIDARGAAREWVR